VAVNKGFETTHSVTLSAFTGALLIQGASSMPQNRTNRLEAFVVNAQHQQDTTAVVAWQSLDTTVLGLTTYQDSTRIARVTSKIVGTGRIVATSGSLVDTLVIHVAVDTSSGPSAPRYTETWCHGAAIFARRDACSKVSAPPAGGRLL